MTHCSSKIIATFFLLQFCAATTSASELSAVATLTSEYIYRGLERSGENPAFQLGADYGHDTGLFAGAWGSTVDLRSGLGQRDIELDYYVGFRLEPEVPVSAMVTILRYTYPGQTGAHSYDYNELLVSVSWDKRYTIELGYTNDLNGLDTTGRHWELRSEWPVANTWVIGAVLGSNDMSDAGVPRYLHWDLGASARVSRLTFDLRWYDNERVADFIARFSANSQIVLSISTAF